MEQLRDSSSNFADPRQVGFDNVSKLATQEDALIDSLRLTSQSNKACEALHLSGQSKMGDGAACLPAMQLVNQSEHALSNNSLLNTENQNYQSITKFELIGGSSMAGWIGGFAMSVKYALPMAETHIYCGLGLAGGAAISWAMSAYLDHRAKVAELSH
jgi:hypothetical protein